MPTTGGSPFFTNSHWPKTPLAAAQKDKMIGSRTGQLVASQPKSVSNNLLVDSALDLEQDLADSHPRSPVVKRTFSFTHSHLPQRFSLPLPCQNSSGFSALPHLVTADVDAHVAALPLVQSVFLSPKSHFDRVLGHLERLGADSSVVVDHSQSVVAPNHRRALGRSSRRYSRPSLGHLLFPVQAGLEPCAHHGRARGKGSAILEELGGAQDRSRALGRGSQLSQRGAGGDPQPLEGTQQCGSAIGPHGVGFGGSSRLVCSKSHDCCDILKRIPPSLGAGAKWGLRSQAPNDKPAYLSTPARQQLSPPQVTHLASASRCAAAGGIFLVHVTERFLGCIFAFARQTRDLLRQQPRIAAKGGFRRRFKKITVSVVLL